MLVAGLFLVNVQSYIQMHAEYKKMVQRSIQQAKVIGNRIASRITLEVKTSGFSKEKMVSLSAPYMAESLNKVSIYNQTLVPIFSRSIPSYSDSRHDKFESALAYKVVKDQFSHIFYDDETKHIIGYFPIDFPIEKGDVLPRHTGVLYLVFDITPEYVLTKEGIIKTAIMNVIIITMMILFFSILMYWFVFRRLDTLHQATQQMAKGNFNVRVQTDREDELTQVINTFNSMAVDINTYINDMQKQVDKAFKEQHEQSKIMIQQSRLASMGEMIGNIAHQWRQPLNALALILQKIELYSKRGKLTEKVLSESVDKATLLIDNMSTTIDDFRDFFKPDKQMEYFELKSVIHDVLVLQDARLKEDNIIVTIDIQPGCWIYGFKNEFAQVIINLINNAQDALAQKNVLNKRIFISAKQKNRQLIFKFSDNAGGIPADILDRIFEPYYTTKEEGKGTGLGLYMSKMIIEENMHGIMHVRNNEYGAEFSIIFKNKGFNDEHTYR